MIVHNDEGEVLLVRHSYRLPGIWTLPAARLGRREGPVATARREVQEEVRCALENATLVEFENTAALEDLSLRDPRFQTYVVDGSTRFSPSPDLAEIDEAAFFPLDALPTPLDQHSRRRLERWALRRSYPIPVPAFVRLEYLEAWSGRGGV
jgi:8-oxo-dGTP pyrophosphatase MutT (NUDIX family)